MNEVEVIYFSCDEFTVELEVDSYDRIVKAAPLVSHFKGQQLNNLVRWAKRSGWSDPIITDIKPETLLSEASYVQ